jgi:hypothetical protein
MRESGWRIEMENEKIQKQKDAERDAALQIYLENKRKEELRRIKQSIVVRLKADLKRPVKYLIKNDKYPEISIPCFTRNDVKDFFPDYPPRRITYMINGGYITPEGFYVDILIKIKRKKKSS